MPISCKKTCHQKVAVIELTPIEQIRACGFGVTGYSKRVDLIWEEAPWIR